jgi:hypothetical protein
VTPAESILYLAPMTQQKQNGRSKRLSTRTSVARATANARNTPNASDRESLNVDCEEGDSGRLSTSARLLSIATKPHSGFWVASIFGVQQIVDFLHEHEHFLGV